MASSTSHYLQFNVCSAKTLTYISKRHDWGSSWSIVDHNRNRTSYQSSEIHRPPAKTMQRPGRLQTGGPSKESWKRDCADEACASVDGKLKPAECDAR